MKTFWFGLQIAIYRDIERERYLMFRESLQSEYIAYHEDSQLPKKHSSQYICSINALKRSVFICLRCFRGITKMQSTHSEHDPHCVPCTDSYETLSSFFLSFKLCNFLESTY